jgi:hypothetical protein
MPTVAVLAHLHPMIGSDFHDEIAPPGVPAPNIPHLVAGMLSFPPWGVATNSDHINPTVLTSAGMAMNKGCDMGFFIPHIPLPPAPANILAPVLTLTSGSKSNFGGQNQLAGKKPLAGACLKVVNLNLNCGGPSRPPLPSGFVLALFQTTWQGMTWGDLIAGALHMLVDSFIQYRINKFLSTGLGGKALNWLMGRIAGALASRLTVMGVRMSTLGVTTIGDLVLASKQGWPRGLRLVLGYGLAEQLPSFLASMGVGTPIGYSPGSAPTSLVEGGIHDPSGRETVPGLDTAEAKFAHSIDNFLNSPSVEQHPSAAPTDAGTPPSGGVPEQSDGGVDPGGGGVDP